MESDSDLVRRTLAGETHCFRKLVQRYQGAVYGAALSKTGSFADAEDIAQEAFLSAFEVLAQLRSPSQFGSWLYRIALSKVNTHLRRSALHEKAADSMKTHKHAAPPADELAARNEKRSAVMSALAALPDANRETATLYYINGYSQKDISKFTNRPIGTIKRRLHDARRQLRKELVTMVETELKRSRPGRGFTERVLSKVSLLRAHVFGDDGDGIFFLRDAKGRSLAIHIMQEEAQAIEPWLTEVAPSDARDIYSVVSNVLNHFGRRIERAVLDRHKGVLLYSTLELESGRRKLKLDCRPSDAINLAVRAGAPIFVSDQVAQMYMVRRKDGKPMSAVAAWRKAQQRALAKPFRSVTEVIRLLERKPRDYIARQALWQASYEGTAIPRMVLDAKGAMRQITSWVKRSKGTRFQALSSGLLGSIRLVHHKFSQAIPHLEDAYTSDPKDPNVAWDLATAYAMAGRPGDAFSTLEKAGKKALSPYRCYANFIKLRGDPRFKKVFGITSPEFKRTVFLAQVRGAFLDWEAWNKRQGASLSTLSLSIPEPTGKVINNVGQLLERTDLLPIRSMSWLSVDGAPSRSWLLLEIGHRCCGLQLRGADDWLVQSAFRQDQFDRPLTPKALSALLNSGGIKLDAAALLGQTSSGVEAALLASGNSKQTVVPAKGAGAISIAIAAKSPILITQSLAEKLYVRGKTGRPLTVRGAQRKLLAK